MQTPDGWSPDSWRKRTAAQHVVYEDSAALDRAVADLASRPPLVTSWEIDRLRRQFSDAEMGKRFVLQGGDCAESFAECRPEFIVNRLKILLQMSLVLIHGGLLPVTRVGRFAGQYAKPRSNPIERRGDIELPSYFGDLVNRPEFTVEARRPDPSLLLTGHTYAALTLNFIRSLSAGGFADLHHPEYWDMSFFERADLSEDLREEYTRMSRHLGESMRFMEALSQGSVADMSRVEFFTCHEALSLHYEAAQTRTVRHLSGYYDLSTHMPWIGERTRALDGAHVEFCRGIQNPVGVKIGPSAPPSDLVELSKALNPGNESGRLVFITRLGAKNVTAKLPAQVAAMKGAGRSVLWLSDPMHGNTTTTSSGIKTRNFDDILAEVENVFDVHADAGSHLGGVHFELTGEDVTECTGGGLGEGDLARNYSSLCDPRLNYRQALEMAFRVAGRMARARRAK
jgi:3-deoxy-7-phosphoheptulonate synthase